MRNFNAFSLVLHTAWSPHSLQWGPSPRTSLAEGKYRVSDFPSLIVHNPFCADTRHTHTLVSCSSPNGNCCEDTGHFYRTYLQSWRLKTWSSKEQHNQKDPQTELILLPMDKIMIKIYLKLKCCFGSLCWIKIQEFPDLLTNSLIPFYLSAFREWYFQQLVCLCVFSNFWSTKLMSAGLGWGDQGKGLAEVV